MTVALKERQSTQISVQKSEQNPAAADATTAAKDVPDRPARLLLVDDDVMALVLMAKGLRSLGYQVDEAANADSALQHLARGTYDLGIFDIDMPGMSGIELAAEIHRTGKLPILFLSGKIDAQTVTNATAEGPVGFLSKPVSVPRLVPTVEAAIATARSIQKSQESCEQLNDALKKKRVVSTAVGVIMTHAHTHREAANQALRKMARDSHRKIEEVAESIVKAAETIHLATAPLRPS
jgi:AmiR/NasT family two-component response regulator